MICKVCQELLHGHKGRRDPASQLLLNFSHHKTQENIQDAAEVCYICRTVCDKLKRRGILPPAKDSNSGFTSATLHRFPRWTEVFRLDIKLEQDGTPVASFVLKQHGDDSLGKQPEATPGGASTSDSEVLQRAKSWVEECEQDHLECLKGSQWHPTRLIDLRPTQDSRNRMVRLVSRKEAETVKGQPSFEGRYVTLSHRWGQADFLKLRAGNLRTFQTAIFWDDLPLTFQQAMTFAHELKVRWIWIDALCIIQGDEHDWLSESSEMYHVYANSYCNISATAAMDSSEGLYRTREPDKLWFDRVSLKMQDLITDAPETIDCIISDLDFWPEYVDHAPVSRRSWVFQERLLAPRVVHWCADQIAFECQRLDRAECRPDGLPNLQMVAGQLLDQARLKVMNREVGGRLRELRLAAYSGVSNPIGLRSMVEQLDPKFHIYEVWKRIVESYTKMEITANGDRLIALSGIARMMTEKLRQDGTEDQYLAGMWENHLASQLLWHVNDEEGAIVQPLEHTRPEVYRAPTFSWASVETRRGVTFPETTDQNLQIEIQVVRLLYKTEADTFGILTDGYLVLKGVLRKIELTDKVQANEASSTSTQPIGNRYSWRLTASGVPFGEPQSIVYLDSPATPAGESSIFGPAAQVYCLPVSEDHEHFYCLLVQATDGDHGVRYRRVGLTKIPMMYGEDVELIKKLIEPPGLKKTILGKYYHGSNKDFWGESHICIV